MTSELQQEPTGLEKGVTNLTVDDRLDATPAHSSGLTPSQIAAINSVALKEMEDASHSAGGNLEVASQLPRLLNQFAPCWNSVETGELDPERCTTAGEPDASRAAVIARALSCYASELLGDSDTPQSVSFLDRVEHVLEQHAVVFCPQDRPFYVGILCRLAVIKKARFIQTSRMTDFNSYIDYYQRAADCPVTAQDIRMQILGILAPEYVKRSRALGSVDDLNRAIEYYQELAVSDSTKPPFSNLINLAAALMQRFERLSDVTDLECGIIAYQDALEIIPPGHPYRLPCLASLAGAFSQKFQHSGDLSDLSAAEEIFEKALATEPQRSPDILQNFGNTLVVRYRLTGNSVDIDNAIRHFEEALQLYAPNTENRYSALNSLATALLSRFEDNGAIPDLNQAITYYRQLLQVYPPGNAERRYYLGNITNALRTRFDHLGNEVDLNEAFRFGLESLNQFPPGHPERYKSLNNFAIILKRRYEISKVASNLDAIVACYEEALQITSKGNPNRPNSLNNLGDALTSRHERNGDIQDLDRAIQGNEEALTEMSHSHPMRPVMLSNLATRLEIRFKRTNDGSDLARAFQRRQDAVDLCPTGSPMYCALLRQLAMMQLLQSENVAKTPPPSTDPIAESVNVSIDSIVELLRRASQAVTSPSMHRLRAARDWATTAQDYDHPSAMSALNEMLGLLDIAVARIHTLEGRQGHLAVVAELQAAKRLVVEAVAYAIEHGELARAVEFFEHGRAVVLGQLSRYRTPLVELKAVNPLLADRLEQIGRQLEESATARGGTAAAIGQAPSEDDISRYQRLNAEWDGSVAEVRAIPGFESFLQRTPYTVLQGAAAEGPIILINISVTRCDALIVSKEGQPLLVELPLASIQSVDNMNAHLARTLPQSQLKKQESDMNLLLRDLWDMIIEPIVDAVQNQLNLPKKSRVWLCPTGRISRLPLHCGGIYTKRDQNFPEAYVVSYTPTLGALIRARRASTEPTSGGMLVIGQPDTPGQVALPGVVEEVCRIKKRIPDATVLEGSAGTRDAVLTGIRQHDWVHFSCHGHLNNQQPFRSHFSLYDNPLYVLDLVEQQLPNAELAFLSACHSAAGDRYTPDEFLHLSAAIQFAGFKSVVGTLWAMADVDGPVLASEFYKHMIMAKSGRRKSCTKAANALREGVKVLRKEKVPATRWINFVHFGV